MSSIPQGIYEIVRIRLLHRYDRTTAQERLADARARAYYPRGQNFGDRVDATSNNDRMERLVQSIIDAEQLAASEEAWQRVFERIDRTFPRGSPEGDTAWLLYHERMSQAGVCSALGIDRQTVRRREDTYICHTAILAAIAGLVGGELDGD